MAIGDAAKMRRGGSERSIGNKKHTESRGESVTSGNGISESCEPNTEVAHDCVGGVTSGSRENVRWRPLQFQHDNDIHRDFQISKNRAKLALFAATAFRK